LLRRSIEGAEKESTMQPLKFFLDTHDRRTQTFPEGITKEQFAEFFVKYERAAREEGVVVLRVHVGIDEGRAYCLNMASSVDPVKRAHEKAGLPFDTITEVTTATPGDLSSNPTGEPRAARRALPVPP
jgi:hypothetical protein